MKTKLQIVKIGGNLIGNSDILEEFLLDFAKLEDFKILVHGGGNAATALEEKLGMKPKVIDGRRITSAESLEVVTMVYAGLINKNIVSNLQAKKCNALGLSGADGNTITAIKRPLKDIDYGFAGDITAINTELIITMLSAGICPVFCPITHDLNAQLLNTNADTIAAELAINLAANYEVTLNYCFDKPGVLFDRENEDTLIDVLDKETYDKLKNEGRIASGMLPKLKNCFEALENGVSQVILGNHKMLKSRNEKYTNVVL